MITEIAPAKINLYLHVGPARADGLHDLASLFVFAGNGDRIFVEDADALSLRIEGPFASALEGLPPQDNLIWRAAQLLRQECGVSKGAAITLEKNLPIASGIGGGSADAAAALRALVKLWDVSISDDALGLLSFHLGADVPACLRRAPVNVAGAGEKLLPGPVLPPLWICLVNPGVDMPTGPVFRAFDAANPSPPAPKTVAPGGVNYDAVKQLMSGTRNDLEPAARALAPEIDAVLDYLNARPGALGARMSGSGATCFALFASSEAARRAQYDAESRGWWALASALSIG